MKEIGAMTGEEMRELATQLLREMSLEDVLIALRRVADDRSDEGFADEVVAQLEQD